MVSLLKASLLFLLLVGLAEGQILQVPQGGTGNNSLPQYGVLMGNANNPITSIIPGLAGFCLVSNGPSAPPSWQACLTGGGGGGTFPAVGIANSTGTSWATSFTPTNPIPATYIANPLTQNTTGSAASLSGTLTQCPVGQLMTGIAANGNAQGCAPLAINNLGPATAPWSVDFGGTNYFIWSWAWETAPAYAGGLGIFDSLNPPTNAQNLLGLFSAWPNVIPLQVQTNSYATDLSQRGGFQVDPVTGNITFFNASKLVGGVQLPYANANSLATDTAGNIIIGSGALSGNVNSPLTVSNGTNSLVFSVPATGNPTLSSSSGQLNVGGIYISDLVGTGVRHMKVDALGNVARSALLSEDTAATTVGVLGTGGLIASGPITSDGAVTASGFFTCTPPGCTPPPAPTAGALRAPQTRIPAGAVPLGSTHLADWSPTVATNGQVPTWNSTASQYVPTTPQSGFIAGGDLSGSSTSQQVVGLRGYSVPTPPPTLGSTGYQNFLTWNGSPTASPPGTGWGLSTAVTTINGSGVPAQLIQGGTGISVTNPTPGTTLITNTSGGGGGGGTLAAGIGYNSAVHGWVGTSGIGFIAGNISAVHFRYSSAIDALFNAFYIRISGGADTNPIGLAIWDVTANSMTCHSLGVAASTNAVWAWPCVEQSPRLIAGHDYVFLRASNASTAQMVGTPIGQVTTRFSSVNVSGTNCTFDSSAGISCTSNFTLSPSYVATLTQAVGFHLDSIGAAPPASLTVTANGYHSAESGIFGVGNARLSVSPNSVQGVHFKYSRPYNTSFSTIYLMTTAITGAPAAITQAVAIWDISANSGNGQMVCHSQNYIYSVANVSASFPCVEPSPQLVAGHEYAFLSTTSGGTTDITSFQSSYNLTTRLATPNGVATNGCVVSSGGTTGAGTGITSCSTNFVLGPTYISSGATVPVFTFRLE